MTEAPANPTTAELKDEYGIDHAAQLAVLETAADVSVRLNSLEDGLVAIVGGCAMTSDRLAAEYEGRRLAAFQDERSEGELLMLHRIPPWKPRTNPDNWHGEETTNPVGAYRTLANLATDSANVAIELASRAHVDRYAPMISFGWMGSRKVHDERLAGMLAIRDPKMPLGIKNGVDGNINPAIERVRQVNRLREYVDDPAPAILIYRGGENAQTPDQWETAYRHALDVTEGRLIVDVAHGSEMAHDPAREFNKSMVGQMLAMEAVVRIADLGEIPAGIMIEASDVEVSDPSHRTDPNLPLSIAFEGVNQLSDIKRGNTWVDRSRLLQEEFAEKVWRADASIKAAQTAACAMLDPHNAIY